MKIIIIHGTYGNPEENWFPWLKNELESMGHTVYIPKFPTPENQSLENWLNVFDDYLKFLDDSTILIGHSLGPTFILDILEKIHTQVRAAFFVSGFTGLLGLDFDKLNYTFTDKNFDWMKIKNNCLRFYVLNSDNDPYVPLSKGEELSKNLGVELIILPNAGHVNKAAGYTKFPLLLELVEKELG